MKNLKIFKPAIAILSSASILLLSGCTGSSNDPKKQDNHEECLHMTVYFEDNPVTFKECEGYDLKYILPNGSLSYEVSKDDQILFDGITDRYNFYYVNHPVSDDIVKDSSVQKSK